MLRYVDPGSMERVDLTKEGTLHLPGDTSPEDILAALAKHLGEAVARPDR